MERRRTPLRSRIGGAPIPVGQSSLAIQSLLDRVTKLEVTVEAQKVTIDKLNRERGL